MFGSQGEVKPVNDEAAIEAAIAQFVRSEGDTITVDRRYLEVWRRTKGRWFVLRTMDNTA